MEASDICEPDASGLAAPLALATGAAVALAACGGNDEAPPAAFFRTETAPTRRTILRVDASATTSRLPTATELFDWAESVYPQFFPDHQPNQFADPYTYRYYPSTGNYVGLAGEEVYVLGPLSGGQLFHVGALNDFAPLVLGTQEYRVLASFWRSVMRAIVVVDPLLCQPV
ncbi:MAG: hypothetical protein Q8M01_10855 [Rubrivivax sp.]|nr:hypothetical protein [Rubrivivax sp.]